MRSDPIEGALFQARFAHQTNATLSQVAKAAVKESARTAAGSGGEIVLLDQPDAQAAQRRVAGDARTDDPAAHDQQIEIRQPRNRFFAAGRRAAKTSLIHRRAPARASASRSPHSRTLGTTRSGASSDAPTSSRVVSAGEYEYSQRAGSPGHDDVGVQAIADHRELREFELMPLKQTLQHRWIGLAEDRIGRPAGGKLEAGGHCAAVNEYGRQIGRAVAVGMRGDKGLALPNPPGCLTQPLIG